MFTTSRPYSGDTSMNPRAVPQRLTPRSTSDHVTRREDLGRVEL